jgi:hypothetical protein
MEQLYSTFEKVLEVRVRLHNMKRAMDSILTVSFQQDAFIEWFAKPVNKSWHPLEHLLGNLLGETVAIAHIFSAFFNVRTENSHFLRQFSHLRQ